MVQPNCASCWSHFKFCRPSHRHTHTGRVLPLRSQNMVWRGARFCCIAMFDVPDIVLCQDPERSIQSRKKMYAIYSLWFPSIFSRLCETARVFFCIKKLWRGDEIDSANSEEVVFNLVEYIDLAVLLESVLESAPQFVLQLYAVSVQEEPVEVIQIISLPVSFLSLAWAFTIADQRWHRTIRDLELKHKLALFVTHFFLLSSRLFAVCYFTVSYKWWVIGVLLFHSSAIMIADAIWICLEKGKCKGFVGFIGFALAFFLCIHWLRDDILLASMNDSKKTVQRRIQVLSHVLFVLENFIMVLLYYFSQQSNTWYSLPVTVCVCLFSVLGSVTRVIHFHFLYRSK